MTGITVDPWPGEPLPDAYDLLIYAKNGHRLELLEHWMKSSLGTSRFATD